jgi:hypothetical protein
MYHAATGVNDGRADGKEKRHRLKKAFARLRGSKRYDEGTHNYNLELPS